MFVINRGPVSKDLYPNEIIMLNGFMFDLLNMQNQLIDKSKTTVGNKFTTDKVFNSLLIASGVLDKESTGPVENMSLNQKLTEDLKITTELINTNQTAFRTMEAGLQLIDANLKLLLEKSTTNEPKATQIQTEYDEFNKIYKLIRKNHIIIGEEDLKALNKQLESMLKQFGSDVV